ncbi:SEC-C metal-binding domain-containing protein [Vibrio sp. 10N.261.55.A7]|uniref:SEC-C metal-binding domain-containing protein n=1 Tax=Vibrio sp. 10N.261.55.A7 TaxID=1880851 RepID=UPI000C8674AF|nr:SEC-C metal-binding domain-containing protein [Vibrio sp. 10N.261.55.A7]PMJ93440.1 prepilin peptidase [Vibrio sp. 10N.261.55.A7]
MTYEFLNLDTLPCNESSEYVEGAILAANFAVKPIAPEKWLGQVFTEVTPEAVGKVTEQIHVQFNRLQRNEYELFALLNLDETTESLSDFAEGFMMVWPIIEENWADVQPNDGSLRMLQALLTTFMLAIDQEQTQQQMKNAGIETPPALDDLVGQIDLMVAEVALAADEFLAGGKSQSVNPYKEIGRNDDCPCASGKKFKQCCGQ